MNELRDMHARARAGCPQGVADVNRIIEGVTHRQQGTLTPRRSRFRRVQTPPPPERSIDAKLAIKYARYLRLSAAICDLPGIRVAIGEYSGSNFVERFDVLRILAEEYLPGANGPVETFQSLEEIL